MIIIKNNFQIREIRKSCKLAAKCLEIIEPYVKPGVTTNYLNEIISDFIKKNNATPAPLNYKGFPKETCISVNEVICHGIPDERTLCNGDILNIDVTVILNGFYGDTSKMFCVGESTENSKNLLQASKDSLTIGINSVAPNIPFNRIGYEITNNLKNSKYSIVDKFVGHGCGLHFHEDPKICHYVEEKIKDFGPKIQPGMIFTIEPMINEGVPDCVMLEDNWTAITADKKLSAQYEHMILCTPSGYEILTEL